MRASLTFSYPRWRHFFWRHPESPVLLLSAGSWLFLLAAGAMDTMPLHVHTIDSGAPLHSSLDHWPAVLLRWSIMTAAMMFPTLIPQVRVVAARSLWERRTRAILLFLAGYSVLWLLYGAIAEATLELLRRFRPEAPGSLLPFSLVVAGVWQLTRQKTRSLVSCHFTMPLAPSGWRADFDCCQYGWRTAAFCCVSCWALMFVCAAAGHSLWAMVVVASVSLLERIVLRPRQLWFALALCAFALFTLLAQAL